MATMLDVGEEHGCGRAHWEYEGEHNQYGTPMALMLLPFWTDGCIGSQEGLYFESSGTTPFHFLTAAETSVAPSNPVRDLPDRPMPYSPLDLQRGVTHMQMMGVRYYMAFSPQALAAADEHPDLREVAESPPWKVYEVADSDLVEPLANEPAVLNGMDEDNPAWQRDAVEWFTDPSALDVFLAPDGPDDWQRVDRGERPTRRDLPDVDVSNIDEDDMSLSFDVDRVGVPMLVKTSYFPNWKVSGADGPYHVTPNLMVVVPTSEHVELTYGYTSVEYLGWGSSLAAGAALLLLVRRGPVTFPVRRRPTPTEPADEAGGDEPTEDEDGDGAVSDPEGLFWSEAARDPDEFWGPAKRRPEHLADDGRSVPERAPEASEPAQRAEDPARDGGAGRAPLLHPDGELGDDDPGPFRP
jgi:hypothetical protein